MLKSWRTTVLYKTMNIPVLTLIRKGENMAGYGKYCAKDRIVNWQATQF